MVTPETNKREFNFLAALTAVVVIGYVVASSIALIRSVITWQEFSAAVGPMACLLAGYWVRGEK